MSFRYVADARIFLAEPFTILTLWIRILLNLSINKVVSKKYFSTIDKNKKHNFTWNHSWAFMLYRVSTQYFTNTNNKLYLINPVVRCYYVVWTWSLDVSADVLSVSHPTILPSSISASPIAPKSKKCHLEIFYLLLRTSDSQITSLNQNFMLRRSW